MAHHQYAVSQDPHQIEIVGDEQHGRSALPAKPPEQFKDLFLYRQVQRRSRLVGEQQTGAGCHGSGDHYPLFLAAGKFMRIGAKDALWVLQPDARQPLQGFCTRGSCAHTSPQHQRLCNLIATSFQRV